jgi:hypothetical protein
MVPASWLEYSYPSVKSNPVHCDLDRNSLRINGIAVLVEHKTRFADCGVLYRLALPILRMTLVL